MGPVTQRTNLKHLAVNSEHKRLTKYKMAKKACAYPDYWQPLCILQLSTLVSSLNVHTQSTLVSLLYVKTQTTATYPCINSVCAYSDCCHPLS